MYETVSRTKPKAPQNSLRTALSSKWLELAERSAAAGSWSWDVKSQKLDWSCGMYALFGCDPAVTEPGFETWLRCIHREDREAAHQAVRQSVQQGIPLIIQYRIVHPDGQIHWIDAYGDTVFDRKGQPARMSGFCMDSTLRISLEKDNAALHAQLAETRRLKAELRQSKNQLELALQAAGQGLFEIDLHNSAVLFDARSSKILGEMNGASKLTVRKWDQCIHPDDLADVKAELNAYLLGESVSYQAEFRAKHKNGHWVWLLCAGQRMDQTVDKGAVRIIGTLQDVSKFKRFNDEGTQLIGKLQTLLEQVRSPRSFSEDTKSVTGGDAPQSLSRRQLQTVVMIAKGMSSGAIAKELGITAGTAVSHRRTLMKKLNLHKASDVTRYALRNGLIDDV